ncbi:unnamed protein product [Meloidogyne enterolobii]|uniref:Uncharacterized protein n=1 Tax=Meloidogyne enterolobii TaxID=390850 RepID=A0ACB1ATJ7_MELEN
MSFLVRFLSFVVFFILRMSFYYSNLQLQSNLDSWVIVRFVYPLFLLTIFSFSFPFSLIFMRQVIKSRESCFNEIRLYLFFILDVGSGVDPCCAGGDESFPKVIFIFGWFFCLQKALFSSYYFHCLNFPPHYLKQI